VGPEGRAEERAGTVRERDGEAMFVRMAGDEVEIFEGFKGCLAPS
jgi:hypothetical protein